MSTHICPSNQCISLAAHLKCSRLVVVFVGRVANHGNPPSSRRHPSNRTPHGRDVRLFAAGSESRSPAKSQANLKARYRGTKVFVANVVTSRQMFPFVVASAMCPLVTNDCIARHDPPIPGWMLPAAWNTEEGLPTRGILACTHAIKPGGTRMNWVLRVALAQVTLRPGLVSEDPWVVRAFLLGRVVHNAKAEG